MASLPRPVTKITSGTPEAATSSAAYCTSGLSTMGSISLGWALVAGRKRVPRPATGKTALRIFIHTPGATSPKPARNARGFAKPFDLLMLTYSYGGSAHVGVGNRIELRRDGGGSGGRRRAHPFERRRLTGPHP